MGGGGGGGEGERERERERRGRRGVADGGCPNYWRPSTGLLTNTEKKTNTLALPLSALSHQPFTQRPQSTSCSFRTVL